MGTVELQPTGGRVTENAPVWQRIIGSVGSFAQQGAVFLRIYGSFAIGWLLLMGGLFLLLMNGPVLFIVFHVIWLVLGFIIMLPVAAWWWQSRLHTVMEFPVITASSDIVKRDDDIQIHYRQQFNKDLTFELLRVQLVSQEWVRYTEGTSTYTDTRDHIEDEVWFEQETVMKGVTYSQSFTLKVPDNAMHTWDTASNNKIRWFVSVSLDLPGWLDYRERYPVIVSTEAPHAE